MGLVRDAIPNDIEGLTQWVYRKLRNHHPMMKRELKRAKGRNARQEMLAEVVREQFPKRQFVTAGRTQVGYVLKTGECFVIEIKQVSPAELKNLGVGNLGE